MLSLAPGVGNWHSLFARGWGIDILEMENLQIPGGCPGGGGLQEELNRTLMGY
jgi:hypothetical protein